MGYAYGHKLEISPFTLSYWLRGSLKLVRSGQFSAHFRISSLAIKYRRIQLTIQGFILKPAGLVDWQTGFEQLDHNRHPLLKLNQRGNWQRFHKFWRLFETKSQSPMPAESLLMLDSGSKSWFWMPATTGLTISWSFRSRIELLFGLF